MLSYLLLFMFASVSVCERKPNFLIILTDDQDEVLGGMEPMQNVRRFIANEGVTFTSSVCEVYQSALDQRGRLWPSASVVEDARVQQWNSIYCRADDIKYNLKLWKILILLLISPICCPSRASLLTGMYVHNHMVQNNSISGGCYGTKWKLHEDRTFATVLKNAGYNTFYAGKYMNQYGTEKGGGPEEVPPGWTEWHGLVGNSVYYDYVISNNGVATHSTNEYLTDVIRELGVSYVENQTESTPFLMVLAPPAPHQPFTPAPRHNGTYSNVTAVRHPNFNVAVEDKHWLIRMPPSPLPDTMLPELDRVYRSRWETLLAVDEMVADVVNALESNSLLDDTYLIYTSDNGYHMGQYAQAYDKRQPYETDIKVPLVIKGPGIKKNVKNNQPVLNIDLAPTIIELAGLEVPKSMDGRPIDLQNENMTERYMLIEYYGEGEDNTVDKKCPWAYDSDHLAQCYPQYECKCQDSKNNTFACIRHFSERINRKFCMFADNENFTEMYDLSNDLYEMTNIIDRVFPAVKHWYQLTLSQMLICSGAAKCDHPLEAQNVI